MARLLIGLLAAALFPAAIAAATPPAGTQLDAIRAIDRRIATIGHRLAVANLAWCARSEWRHGLVLLELSEIAPGLRPDAARAFGRDRGLGIMALAAGGPAEQAGLRANDLITGFEGRALPAPTGDAQAQRTAWSDALAAAFADGRAAVDILRGGVATSVQVRGERGCATIFQGVPRRSRNANADGVTVNINAGLIDFAQDDAELAAAMAHEFAHNILAHRVALHGPPVPGRARPSVRATEIEADRLSVYLMERAGYDPRAAVRLWTRLGPHPLNFLRTGGHPGWRQRVQLFEAEIVRIRAARAAGREPVPDFATLPRPD